MVKLREETSKELGRSSEAHRKYNSSHAFRFLVTGAPSFCVFFIVDSFLSQVAAVSVDVSAASLYYETKYYNVML